MKVTTVIDEGREEEIVVYTHGDTAVADRVRQLFEKEEALIGYIGDEIVRLEPREVYCFFTEDGRTYALTERGKYLVKLPLYRIENSMSDMLVRINQSCLVAVRAITGFKASIGGSLAIVLKGGYTDYVSRRQVKAVKKRFGIG